MANTGYTWILKLSRTIKPSNTGQAFKLIPSDLEVMKSRSMKEEINSWFLIIPTANSPHINPLAPELFFFNFSTPVYKM